VSFLWKNHKISILFIALGVLFYELFAYELDRTDFLKLLGLYLGLFLIAYQLHKSLNWDLKSLLAIGLLFRLIFLLAMPNLSQDFYRFIWDGQLNLIGINPYLSTPDELMKPGILSNFPNQVELHEGMGELSRSHYSNYPPVNQLFFTLATLFPGASILSSIIGLRLIIILADIGMLFIGVKILKILKLPISNLFWYVLNPFVIIELTGNLHFEGVMLFFLLLSLYLLSKKQIVWAAICFGLSISAKLIPLMLLPLFLGHFKKGEISHLFQFYLITGLTVLLSFLPFLSTEFFENYSSTIGLWFSNFEFNASIYYLFREIGIWITGYNQIALIGKLLAAVSVSFILYTSLTKNLQDLKHLIRAMLLCLTVYLLLSTTVHPWYLVSLVVLAILSDVKYPLSWSLTVVLSYFAYSQPNFKENYWILALEYLPVMLFLVLELKRKDLAIPLRRSLS